MNEQVIEYVLDFIINLKKQVSDCEHEAEKFKTEEGLSDIAAKANKKLSDARMKYSDALFLTLFWSQTLPSEDCLNVMQKLSELIL